MCKSSCSNDCTDLTTVGVAKDSKYGSSCCGGSGSVVVLYVSSCGRMGGVVRRSMDGSSGSSSSGSRGHPDRDPDRSVIASVSYCSAPYHGVGRPATGLGVGELNFARSGMEFSLIPYPRIPLPQFSSSGARTYFCEKTFTQEEKEGCLNAKYRTDEAKRRESLERDESDENNKRSRIEPQASSRSRTDRDVVANEIQTLTKKEEEVKKIRHGCKKQ